MLLAGGVSRPISSSARSGRKRTTGLAGRSPCTSVSTHPARPGELDEELRCESRRLLREIRVDAFLPTAGALGAQAQALGAAKDPIRLEVGRLEEHVGRGLADLRVFAAHDPGERDRALRVRDHEVVRRQLPFEPVERAQLLARVARAGRRCGRRAAWRSRRRAAGSRARASRSS